MRALSWNSRSKIKSFIKVKWGTYGLRERIFHHRHLVENDPEGPDVDGPVVRLMQVNLRRHVNDRPDGCLIVRVSQHELGDSEVGDLQPVVLVDQNVLGLQVAVDDRHRVQIFDAGDDVHEQRQQIVLPELPQARLELIYHVAERPMPHVLQHKIPVDLRLVELDKCDDAWMAHLRQHHELRQHGLVRVLFLRDGNLLQNVLFAFVHAFVNDPEIKQGEVPEGFLLFCFPYPKPPDPICSRISMPSFLSLSILIDEFSTLKQPFGTSSHEQLNGQQKPKWFFCYHLHGLDRGIERFWQ